MSRRPRILITLDSGSTDRRGIALETVVTKSAYGEQVARAGGIPLYVATTDDVNLVSAMASVMDGLVVTGGYFDIPPQAYGASANGRRLDAVKSDRTRFENDLLNTAMQRRCPILAVCGGMQLLNVVLGGTLLIDIGADRPGALDHEQPTSPATPGHPLKLVPHTAWTADLDTDAAWAANSTHHQALDVVAPELTVWAHAPDGIIEAVGARHDPAVVGVQWHPELLDDPLCRRLYGQLVAEARRRMV
ncbi:MAG: gamma-glutamyl-gamma-aminobutyrate hydrolase family protein [Myxococcota bacterium]